uniref:VWF/SSPO/Zonadhesin-like cysteine-rich domain-containing protein n=1 Tax=Bos mutus grunniens TaxID=30521 RepID=A0A8B9YRM2_BOSMU
LHSLFAQSCLFDSCHVPSSNLECASLQTHAALCAQEGICVDWRNHTGGPAVIPACGPTEEPSCKSSPSQPNSTRLVEGCFCPEGTTSHAPGFDVCVDLCGCVGPDNVPREFDCKDCICLEGGAHHLQAQDVPAGAPAGGEEDGTYPLTEVDPANTCCNVTSCSKAPTGGRKAPLCSLGFQVKSEIVPRRCCPYTVARVGPPHPPPCAQSPPPVYSSKCQNCACTDRRDNATQLNVIACTHVPCNTTCTGGRSRECCKKCQQTHCIITRPGQQSLVLKVRPPRPQGRERPASRQDTCLGFWALWVASPSQATAVGHGPSGDCGRGSLGLHHAMPNGCCRKCEPASLRCHPVMREISHNGCTAGLHERLLWVLRDLCHVSPGRRGLVGAGWEAVPAAAGGGPDPASQVLGRGPGPGPQVLVLQGAAHQPAGGDAAVPGRALRHTYTHVDSCLCQDTLCELPTQRRARRPCPSGGPRRGEEARPHRPASPSR